MSDFYLAAQIAVGAAIYAIDKLYDYLIPEDYVKIAHVGCRVEVPFGRGNKKSPGFIVALKELRIENISGLKSVFTVYNDSACLSAEDIAISAFLKNHYFCTFFEAANSLVPPGVWSKNAEVYTPGKYSMEKALFLLNNEKPVKSDIVRKVYRSPTPVKASEFLKQTDEKNIARYLKELVCEEYITLEKNLSRSISDKFVAMASLTMPIEEAEAMLPAGKQGERRKEVLRQLSAAGTLPVRELIYLTGASPTMIKNLIRDGFVFSENIEVYRRPAAPAIYAPKEIVLNDIQQQAYDRLLSLLDGKPHGALLYGVTGSGKTEIYIKLIQYLLSQEKTAILLVPEIALTPQMVHRFQTYFGNDVAIIHSGLTTAQRYDEYKRIRAKRARVAVGTRTAVFAPLENIGVIIVDEEQEYTYKSENSPRYHAVDVAKFRAAKHNCLVLLGSATPSVTTRFLAQEGKIALVRLDARYNDMPLPKAVISDMRGKLMAGGAACIGDELREEIERNIQNGEKTILFLNRRGASNRINCIDCGYIPVCKNCSVALVYHSKSGRMMCHHCGYSEKAPEVCPKCGSKHLKYEGIGTQRVEDELKEIIPGVRIVRMDADTVVGRTSHEKLLDDFVSGDYDILLGTQMVAKGLDFEAVTLVGVIDGDGFMHSMDFRAQERAFSLMTQVVGRAGRHDRPGRAVIQTYSPKNPVIISAARQDYDAFYDYEISARRAMGVPPFADIFIFTLTGESENMTLRAALAFSASLVKYFQTLGADIDVLGPVAPPIAKISNRYRFSVSFRGQDGSAARSQISDILASFEKSQYSRTVTVLADINPYSL